MKKICNKCGVEVSAQNYSRHLKRCIGTGFSYYKPLPLPCNLLCQYCNKELKNLNALRQHECRCPKNPNRRDFDKLGKHSTNYRKGQTKDSSLEIAKQRQTVLKKYVNGYVSPIKGRHIEFEYLYAEHNQEEINKWLDYTTSISLPVNSYSKTIHPEGYILLHTENGYITEQEWIMNILLDGKLSKNNIVHHINKHRGDNRKENLLAFVDSDNHKRFHNSIYAWLTYDENTHLFSCEMRK